MYVDDSKLVFQIVANVSQGQTQLIKIDDSNISTAANQDSSSQEFSGFDGLGGNKSAYCPTSLAALLQTAKGTAIILAVRGAVVRASRFFSHECAEVKSGIY